LFVRDQFDRTLDADLPVQRLPDETQCGVRVAEQLLRFPAFKVGVEREPALIQPLQQHSPRRWPALRRRRREYHGMRIRLALPCFIQPSAKGREWLDLEDLI